MSSRKAELLDGALKYLVRRGIANVSLRPMAAELGTSPRILMFHFGSKEGLLQDIFAELHSRLQASLKAMVSSGPHGSRDRPLKRFWLWATAKQNFPYFRLLYEVQVVALQNPQEYGPYLRNASANWQSIALDLMSPPLKNKPMASLSIAVFDGLMLELMGGGDKQRLTKSLDLFISLATVPSSSVKPKRPNRKT